MRNKLGDDSLSFAIPYTKIYINTNETYMFTSTETFILGVVVNPVVAVAVLLLFAGYSYRGHTQNFVLENDLGYKELASKHFLGNKQLVD